MNIIGMGIFLLISTVGLGYIMLSLARRKDNQLIAETTDQFISQRNIVLNRFTFIGVLIGMSCGMMYLGFDDFTLSAPYYVLLTVIGGFGVRWLFSNYV